MSTIKEIKEAESINMSHRRSYGYSANYVTQPISSARTLNPFDGMSNEYLCFYYEMMRSKWFEYAGKSGTSDYWLYMEVYRDIETELKERKLL